MIETLDFVGVPTQDFERAKKFYGETLGLRRTRSPRPSSGSARPASGSGSPSSRACRSRPQKNGPLALHVADVAEARAPLEEKGVEFAGDTFDTGSATWPSARTRTATT